MPRKSKWEDVDESFSTAPSIRPLFFNYDYKFVALTIQTVREAAYQAVELQSVVPLAEALRKVDFPFSGNPTLAHARRAGFYIPNQALPDIAEALWYAYGPPPTSAANDPRKGRTRAHARSGRRRSLKTVELFCRRFREAWALLEGQVIYKLSDARDALIEEVIAQTVAETMPDKFPVSTERLMSLATAVEDSERLRRFEGAVAFKRAKAADKLLGFGAAYGHAYRIVTDAKARAAKLLASVSSEERRDWEEDIKSRFPELKTHPDLIKRLAGPQDLPEWVDIALAEKGGASSVQDIALELAARLCGNKPYSYTRRGLLKRLEKEGKLRDKFLAANEADNERSGFGFVRPLHTLLLNWWRTGHRLPPRRSPY